MIYSNGLLTPSEPAIDLVRLLSQGTYTSFPRALKEFVSNAYDADALRVDIKIDDDCNGITIRDNGNGMTLDDFGTAFASIARSGGVQKGVKRGRTRMGRVKIGRFGIGSLAVVTICDHFSVRSSKKGSHEGFVARKDMAELRNHFGKQENLSELWTFEAVQWDTEKFDTHFTELKLDGLSPDIRALLEKPGTRKITEPFESISQLSGMDQLLWHLGVICPVPYENGYAIPERDLNPARDAVLIDKARRLLRNRFAVTLNGTPVRRRIIVPTYKENAKKNKAKYAQLVQRGLGYDLTCFRSKSGAPVRYEGYIAVQAQQLFPKEQRGLIVRLRGVAVGDYRTFHLGGDVVSTMLPNLSGEIWVDTGLDDALQFDRESFREDHPQFMIFREEIEKKIAAEAKPFRQRSSERNQGKSPATEEECVAAPVPVPQPQPIPAPIVTAGNGNYIDPEIFKDCPPYLYYLIPQINGCWDRQWYEACALTTRRLLETLIIHLFQKRGWTAEIRTIDGYLKLKELVDKVTGDPRIGLDRRSAEGLQHLKNMGDIAAHDFKVRLRKSYLESKQAEFSLACERLIFIANN
jgi:hypothetical protein